MRIFRPATTGGTRSGSAGGMQFIVISLKQGLFGESETLVGVARDQARMSSRTVTLDVSFLPSLLFLGDQKGANALGGSCGNIKLFRLGWGAVGLWAQA